MVQHVASTEKVTLSFPRDLVRKVKARAAKGELSRFVAEAVREKLEAEERALLREELKEGYRARAALHKELAREFFEAEEEAYSHFIPHGQAQRKARL
jgi:metal-responsive CopG/Arc/MetJ family transcriptional regulator